MQAVLRARAGGVPTFGITDGSTTPIAMHCDAHLLAPIGTPSFTGSYVAPMALINAITLACTHLQPKRALGDEAGRARADRGRTELPSRPNGNRPRRQDGNGRKN